MSVEQVQKAVESLTLSLDATETNMLENLRLALGDESKQHWENCKTVVYMTRRIALPMVVDWILHLSDHRVELWFQKNASKCRIVVYEHLGDRCIDLDTFEPPSHCRKVTLDELSSVLSEVLRLFDSNSKC